MLATKGLDGATKGLNVHRELRSPDLGAAHCSSLLALCSPIGRTKDRGKDAQIRPDQALGRCCLVCDCQSPPQRDLGRCCLLCGEFGRAAWTYKRAAVASNAAQKMIVPWTSFLWTRGQQTTQDVTIVSTS